MSTCFVYGSDKNGSESFLDLTVTIEYLEFDFSEGNESVYIINDFFIRNLTDSPQIFSCIHRGKINFTCYNSSWVKDPATTKLLSTIAGREIGLDIHTDTDIQLLDNRYDHLRDSVNSKSDRIYGPDKDLQNVPYTLVKSPVIAPHQNVVFRVVGKLAGPPSRHLLQNYFDHKIVRITGGKPLINEIQKDCGDRTFSTEYKFVLDDFIKNKMIIPGSFHVFAWEKVVKTSLLHRLWHRPKPFSCYALSSDIMPGKENIRYKDKIINWYWSDAGFYFSQYSEARGPILEMHRGSKILNHV